MQQRYLITAILLALCVPALAGLQRGAPRPNSQSPLGVVLSDITPFANEQPFINVVKTGGGWYTINGASDTAEEAYLYTNCLDANGYPVTLTTTVGSCASGGHTFNAVSFITMVGQTNYAGTWVFDYDNTGTFAIGKDGSAYTACAITGHPNRHLLTSSAAGVGIGVTMTATGSGSNYAQNIKMTYAPTSTCNGVTIDPRETQLYSSAALDYFNPDFINRIQSFTALRMMDWMYTNGISQVAGSNQGSWVNRPPVGWVFWDEGTINSPGQASGTPYMGVPIEVMVAVCNKIRADCWFNMPHQADNTYITNFANLVHSLLNGALHVYVEYSNEVWNPTFAQHAYVGNQAQTLFGANWNEGGYNWQGMRTAQMGTLWKNAWGSDSGRIFTVIGVQGAISSTGFATFSDELLTTPLWTGTGTLLQFTGSISGTTLNITAISSGSPQVNSPVRGVNADVSLGTKITACPGGVCGSTGSYTVNNSQTVGSETMIGGGGAAPGGPAQPSMDVLAGAPYWGYNPPTSWTSDADGGLAKTFTEINSGGLMPTGTGACTTSGTSTAYTIVSNVGNCGVNGSVACPTPADQTIFPLVINQTAGTNPTLAVDGCGTTHPIDMDQSGGLVAATGSLLSSGSTWNVTYQASASAWVVTNLGSSGGMLAFMASIMNTWSSYASGKGLRYVGYESGQTFSGNSTMFTAPTTGLLYKLQKDVRMQAAYGVYYNNWKAAGGTLIMHFDDIESWGTFGFWGSLEQNPTQQYSPKYDGLMDFVRKNQCWWANCKH